MTALRPIKKKIQSERGASITFALLLFLVCAVVGSSVLVAGSAASGRLSQIAENDQRYYSVNSAARLLIDLVEADEVKVEKRTDESGDTTYSYKLNNSDAVADDDTQFQSLALEAAYQIVKMSESETEKSHTLKLGKDPENNGDPLTVTVEETIFRDGRIEFEVYKEDTKEPENRYLIRLVFHNIGSDIGTERTFRWRLNDVESVRETPPPAGNGGETP